MSEWTIDTLHDAIKGLCEERDRRYSERLDRMESGFSAHLEDARREVFLALTSAQQLVSEVDRRHSEKFMAAEKAVDAAFLAQQLAMHTAFAASEKAVQAALAAADKAVETRATSQEREFHEHLEQYRHEVDLAFTASDRAITKAELANEKRFESVNEFRNQLNDQAARLLPRAEAEVTIGAMGARVSELASVHAELLPRAQYSPAHDRLVEQVRELNDRITRAEGKGAGMNAGWVYLVGAVALIGTILTIYLALRPGG